MSIRVLLLLFVFCTLTSSAQEIDMSVFKDKIDIPKIKIPIEEVREQQKGIQLNFNYSIHPKSSEFRVNYLKESFLPIGIYLGYGITELFTYTTIAYDDVHLEFIREPLRNGNDYDSYLPDPYFLIGLSKNISSTYTIYLGYAKILGIKRGGDWLEETNFEESTCIDFGASYRFRKLSLNLGSMWHLPYYDMKDRYGDEFGVGMRLQIGIGYNL